MAKRTKIGLIYQYNENWIGGTYYIQNLISAINRLPDAEKPELVILTKRVDQYEDLKKTVSYPYISRRNFVNAGPVKQLVNKISKKLVGKKLVKDYHEDIDLVFPASQEAFFKPAQRFLYWIPDFQEHYLPQFFTEAEVNGRKSYQQKLVSRAKYILFSSLSVQRDFEQIYPQNGIIQFVVPFAVTHSFAGSNYRIIDQYQLPKQYFICCNQFWKHKNHVVVLEAIALLKQLGTPTFVAFTGKESDYRNPDFFASLQKKVSALGVEDCVKFLGFISREDQLALIQQSLAVIQPSLFEGWSTVIEDAKALGVHIIASDIDVHKEQLTVYNGKQFFSPKLPEDLARCMEHQKLQTKRVDYDYEQQVVQFGTDFKNAVEQVLLY